MRHLTVELAERSYPILIGAGLLDDPSHILSCLSQHRVAIVTNRTVAPLYLDRLASPLEAAGVQVVRIVLPDGEDFKNWQTLNLIFDELIRNRCERRTTLIGLGGGVVGDMTGFAAATWQRGAPFIQVPTTLLAQVDSSVGGKTAINHPQGKNMIGAFYQPRLVLTDLDTLRTLPERELQAGMAEVIKHGLIRDGTFFAWLEQNLGRILGRDPDAMASAIQRCCEIKAEVVAMDEREEDVRAWLNFGHTFGHAIEAGMGYGEWLHGEAVAAGMMIAAHLSLLLGMLKPDAVDRIEHIIGASGLPTRGPAWPTDRYIELMSVDKKARDGALRFVLLDGLGKAMLRSDISRAQLDQALRSRTR